MAPWHRGTKEGKATSEMDYRITCRLAVALAVLWAKGQGARGRGRAAGRWLPPFSIPPSPTARPGRRFREGPTCLAPCTAVQRWRLGGGAGAGRLGGAGMGFFRPARIEASLASRIASRVHSLLILYFVFTCLNGNAVEYGRGEESRNDTLASMPCLGRTDRAPESKRTRQLSST